MEDSTSLINSVHLLEHSVNNSNIKYLREDCEKYASSVLTAFALINGIMECNYKGKQNYDALKEEVDSCISSLSGLRQRVISTSFNKDSDLESFINPKIKRVRQLKKTSPSRYPYKSLGESVLEFISLLPFNEEQNILNRIGNDLKDELFSQQKKGNRVSPNYISEISVLYKLFNSYNQELKNERADRQERDSS